LLPSELWRTPRLRVLVNGMLLTNAKEAIVLSTGSFSADVFRVRAALGDDAAFWAAIQAVSVDIQIALEPFDSFVSLVQGQADLVILDPIAGVLTLEGRDQSAVLIEARTQETFANRTASEIATILAERHGLVPDVQSTTTPIGRYWELEHDSLILNSAARATTEWDLLVQLAGWEGYDLWVSGSVLHFRPAGTAAPRVLRAATLAGEMPDITSLKLERALSFAGDVAVTVKSWHSRLGSGCIQTARTNRGGASTREYVFVVPNLSPDAARRLAEQRLAEMTSHELVVRAEMPGDLMLTPRDLVQLIGTGTMFDTTYRVAEIERRISVQDGFTQRLYARASS
jgi:hypothetical protein